MPWLKLTRSTYDANAVTLRQSKTGARVDIPCTAAVGTMLQRTAVNVLISGAFERVLDHLDLPFAPECARFYENEGRVRTVGRAQVRRPVNASGLGRWRAYEPHLASWIKEVKRADLVED